MSSKIVMAVFDTEANERTHLTIRTLYGLLETVNFSKHQLFISDNGSCEATQNCYKLFMDDWRSEGWPVDNLKLCLNGTNIGTARAVNKGIAERQPGQFIIKMDNDVIVHANDWVGQMELAMQREPRLGILGLKRRDLLECTTSINTDHRSKLIQLPHNPGEHWQIIEVCKHIMGTCTMLSPALLDKLGGFYQDGVYGFDDSLLCVRAHVGGFMTAFLSGIDIDHIDPGGDEYTKEKADYAELMFGKYVQAEKAYTSGLKSIYESI